MENSNLIYVAYLDAINQKPILQYPDPPSKGTSVLITWTLDQIFEQVENNQFPNDISLDLEDACLFSMVEDSYNYAFVLITLGKSYPRRFASSLLNEFAKKLADLNDENNDISINEFNEYMRNLFIKYDNKVNIDAGTKVKFKVDDVVDSIGITIQQVVNSCANVELLEEKSDHLHKHAVVFNNASTELNNYFKRQRIIAFILIFVVILAVALYIAIPFMH